MSHLGHRLSALIDGELSHPQRERALAHLARCEACRREAAALRALKQRMHALGEAPADATLTDRLFALGASGPVPGSPGLPRHRWPVRLIAAACLAVAGLGLPTAAFLAGGGGQQEPGPGVTPMIDLFVVQHDFSTGDVPARPLPSSAPVTVPAVPRQAHARHNRPAETVPAG